MTFVCTRTCSICIDINGDIYSFGDNSFTEGNLGHRENEIIKYPKQIQTLQNIKYVGCGMRHTICCDHIGNLYSFGDNIYGKLGINKSHFELYSTTIPQKVIIPPIKDICCGPEFSICISMNGKLYSFGRNIVGELGNGSRAHENSPYHISDITNAEIISCGRDFVICKTINGDCYSWGGGTEGRLGQYTSLPITKPIKCIQWPNDIISIKSGNGHSILLTIEGNVYGFGSNISGRIGFDKNIKYLQIPTLIKDIPLIKRIETGDLQSYLIDIDNNLWVCGYNVEYQLGVNNVYEIYKPILHPNLPKIIDISHGGNHAFVKTIDNEIYGFGYAIHLEEIPNNIKKTLPIQVFIDKEDIWDTKRGKSRAKSARK